MHAAAFTYVYVYVCMQKIMFLNKTLTLYICTYVLYVCRPINDFMPHDQVLFDSEILGTIGYEETKT